MVFFEAVRLSELPVKFKNLVQVKIPSSLLIPPENIRKVEVFWCFNKVSKEISGMKWVKEQVKKSKKLHAIMTINCFVLFFFFFKKFCLSFNPVSINHKTFKHTHTIRRQKPTNYLNVFPRFVGLVFT